MIPPGDEDGEHEEQTQAGGPAVAEPHELAEAAEAAAVDDAPEITDAGDAGGFEEEEATHAGNAPAGLVEALHAEGLIASEAGEIPEGLDGAELPPEGEGEAAVPEGEAGLSEAHLQSIVESMLFAADKPLALQALGMLLGATDLGPVRAAVAAIEEHYQARGVQLHSVAGGYQFRTNPANAVWVQKLLAQKPVRLTRAQLETLAICAYRQPITRPEVDDIRGVDSGGALKSLMDRSLVRILGKKEEPGRPLLYGTTREFLDFFSLGDLKDLPTLREFHELTEEHQAQVAALEEKAPAGSVETLEEAEAAAAAAAVRKPLERVTLHQNAPEDAAELEEIDRLIATADRGPVVLDPTPPPAGTGDGDGGPEPGKGQEA